MIHRDADQRRRVSVIVPWVSRAAGGLFDAARNLTLEMERQRRYLPSVIGVEDKNWVSDRALWGKIDTQALPGRGPHAFGYAPAMSKLLELQDPDLLHVHGLWMYPSVAAVRWARRGKPYVISPHGMLDAWALKNSGWKKRICAALYEDRHLRGAACIHVLNVAEERAVRAYGLKNPICLIPNGVELPEVEEVSSSRKSRYLLYLGRLHPKKGLPVLVNAWSRIQKTAVQAGWQLRIAGWDQNGHQSELEALTEKLDAASSISFIGPQFGEAKSLCFQKASAFVLPSLSEGLPISVLEAWSWRLPVVMTPNCNLPEGLKAGAAIMTEANVESIGEALCRVFAMSDLELDAIGARGRQLVEQRFHWPHIVQQLMEVYDWILGCSPQPACVTI
jgi:glycosyltransferase involved in cell wall biosynthesis